MPNAVKWEAAYVDRGDVDSGGALDSLADGSRALMATAIANETNLDRFGVVELELGSLNPGSGAYMIVYLVRELDSSTYEDGSGSVDPAAHRIVDAISIPDVTSSHRIATRQFELPPCDFKIVVQNHSGIALASSANACNVYTTNEEIQ